MKGIGCLIILALIPFMFAAWYLVTMVCPFLFLLFAILIFRHHWPSAVVIAIPAGFAIYVIFSPLGLVLFLGGNIDGGLAVALAALATILCLGRQFDEAELALPKTFLFGNALFLVTMWLLGFMICALMFIGVVELL